MEGRLELIVTCDEGYLPPLETMLVSLAINNPRERVRVWLLHSSLSSAASAAIVAFGASIGISVQLVQVDPDMFGAARSSERYPKEMYYRLIAAHLIAPDIGRALYLDPDILVINELCPLYQADLGDHAFAAASHTDRVHPATALNNIRLDTGSLYFNTGVLLFDCDAARKMIDPLELFEFVEAHESSLLFPDQDVFNMRYGDACLPLDDVIWNFDARKLIDNTIRTRGVATLDWVMENTAILHFCGRDKPWAAGYRGPFSALYKHYASLAARVRGHARMEGA